VIIVSPKKLRIITLFIMLFSLMFPWLYNVWHFYDRLSYLASQRYYIGSTRKVLLYSMLETLQIFSEAVLTLVVLILGRDIVKELRKPPD